MSDQVTKEIELEIAHILFIDTVGYSKLSINEQRAVVDELPEVVRNSDQYQKAEAADRLIKIPAGDGMALVFYTSPEAPAQCAVSAAHDPLRHVEPGAREVGATRHVYHAAHRTAVPVRVRVALLGIPIGGMKRSAAGIFASSLASSA